ncbi:Aspartic proteinase nepenthesin-1 [Bienertia sinuspersici]
MIPIDSPELEMYPESLSTQQHHELLMNITKARVSLYTPSREESMLYKMLSNFYATQLFFGTSNELLNAYVLFDTGGINTWVQCEGCNPCFQLEPGNIEMSKSKTYKLLSLYDQRCNPHYVYGNEWCGYQVTYGGGAISIGVMGTDTFVFINSETRIPEFFPNLAFGCGIQNYRVTFGRNTGPKNQIAGIFGLAPGPQSFLNQLDTMMKGRFSYCLTSWTENKLGKSTIHFGDDAQIGTGPDVQHIRLSPEARYHLFFTGISVDGKRLPIDSSICPLNTSHIRGFTIDSGAPYTILPLTAYKTLRAAVATFFDRYGWRKVGGQEFDLCYVVPTGSLGSQPFPKVVFHFENGDGSGSEVDWVMKNNNMFVRFDRINGFCMVVTNFPNDIMKQCIFGAYQHSNFRVLYDVKNSKLSFKPERCQENT